MGVLRGGKVDEIGVCSDQTGQIFVKGIFVSLIVRGTKFQLAPQVW
jgi:hypothetical protein